MTITITVLCDARGCSREAEISDDTEKRIVGMGWNMDPVTAGQHYCPKCWPKVKQELEEG